MLELFDAEFNELENQLARVLGSLQPSEHGFPSAEKISENLYGKGWSLLRKQGWFDSDNNDAEGSHGAGLRAYALFRNIGYYGIAGPFLGLGVFKRALVTHLNNTVDAQILRAASDDSCAVAWDGRPVPAKEIVVRQGRLQGKITHVVDGHNASSFLVIARDAAGDLRLFQIDRNDTGVATQQFLTVDGHPATDLQCEQVNIEGKELKAPSALIERAYAVAWVATAVAASAECAGLAQRLTKDTTDYVRLRTQFGQPIGAFQVVQHALVNAYIASEESLSLALSGAVSMHAADREQGQIQIAANVLLGTTKRALSVAKTAVQLHGAIGFTDELPVGAYFRRITYLSKLLAPKMEQDMSEVLA